MAELASFLLLVFIFVVSLAGYLLPTLVAAARTHSNLAAIFILNFFLGWTLVGWVAALVWSVTAQPLQKQAL